MKNKKIDKKLQTLAAGQSFHWQTAGMTQNLPVFPLPLLPSAIFPFLPTLSKKLIFICLSSVNSLSHTLHDLKISFRK
jgi:hypothetical protein